MTTTRRLWLVLGFGVVLIALAVDLSHRAEATGIDFHTYEAAARVGLQQGWSHIYDQPLVAAEQKLLVPSQRSQPFLSTPPVAWLAAALAPLPYVPAYAVWAVLALLAFAAALAWSGASHGVIRWIAVAAAIAPWWVLHAVVLGQVVPLVAACVVVAWRLLREDRNVAAGLVLSSLLLKPNTAILVPIALLVAGRHRSFMTWAVAAAALVGVSLLMLGPHGASAYLSQLAGPLPRGAQSLTLEGALGIGGVAAAAVRLAIVGAALAAAFRLRESPGLVIAVAAVASLLVAPYLHASDLCLLAAAGWMVWEDRPAAAWRAALAVGWIIASPFVFLSGVGPSLNRWPLLELVLLAALVVAAWRPLTGAADLRTRAPA
ncbi:DUF2029 domain-containing protein [bacterium]|nr:MAG: DUF2029 domain-containing protein [bacterium]